VVSKFNEESGEGSDYYYGYVLRQFQSLGFCDCDNDGINIYVSPPRLVALPSKIFNEVILIGARTPGLILKLKKAVNKRKGRGIYISVKKQADPNYGLGLPELIKITSIYENDIKEIAEEVGIKYSIRQPASFSLLKYAMPISYFWEHLEFKKIPEINWEKRVFSLDRLCFSTPNSNSSEKHRLIEYTNPTNRTRLFYIYKGNLSAEIGPEWGRYILLSLEGKNVLYYDHEKEELYVPAWVALPTVLSRAASLSSGEAPLLKRNFKGGLDYFTYTSIPDFIAKEIAWKLGQKLQSLNTKSI